MKVKFFDLNADKPLKYAVICARYNGKWVFCKHKNRDTYEIPGGHREDSEDIDILQFSRTFLKDYRSF